MTGAVRQSRRGASARGSRPGSGPGAESGSGPGSDPGVATGGPTTGGVPSGVPASGVPVAALAWSTAIVGLGAAALGATYAGWLVTAGLVALCLAIAALVALGAVARLPRRIAPLVIVALVLAGAMVSMLRAPRLGADAALAEPLWRLMLDAVPHLLTTPPDTPPRWDLVVPAALAVTAAATIACVRALARGRGRPLGVAPAIGGAALYGCAMLLSAGGIDREGVIAGALVVLVLLSWVRPTLPVVGVLLVCGFSATVVAAVAFPPGRDVRTVISPPSVAVSQPNVMPYLSLWADQSDLTLFTVSGRVPDRIAVAVYPGYDGDSWSSGSRFALVGTPRPGALPVGRLYADYRMRVTPGDLPLDWLPSAGAVTAVSLPDALQDLTGGGLLRVGGHAAPKPYTVSGRIDVPDDAAVAAAGVPGADAAGAYLAVPSLPQSLQTWVDTHIRPFRGRYAQAAALEADLRRGRTLDATLPGSTSVAAIADLVANPSARAPAEVYASAFAVLARSVGLPTRLVIGARISQHPGVIDVHDRAVTSGQITVWPEVYFSQVGWVPFDPSPGGDTAAQLQHAQIRDGGAPVVSPPVPPAASPSAPPAPATPGFGVDPVDVAVVLAGLLALLLLAAAVAGWVARRRMFRRGAAGAFSLIEGAAVLAGLPVRAHSSAEGVAAVVGSATNARVGDHALAVAAAAQRECFAPVGAGGTGPGGTGPGGDGAATEGIWSRAVAVRRAVRRTVAWRRRWRWFLAPAGWRMAPLSAARPSARPSARPAAHPATRPQ